MKQRKSKKTGTVSKVFLIAGFLFSVSTIFFAWKIADYLIDSHRSQNYWNELQNAVFLPAEQDGEEFVTGMGEQKKRGSETPAEAGGIPAEVDFDRFHTISDDVAAWLLSPGTTINYVVVQGPDNDYYLHRLPDGTYAKGGTLFIDWRCAADFTDWNTVVYGHYMKNGTMFAELANYQDPDYYKEHPVMYLYIPGKRYKLDLIAGYTTDIYDELYSLPASKEARDEVLAKAVRKSSFVSGVTVGEEDRLVTLSTCSYVYENARYVVLARITEELIPNIL